MEEKKNNVLSFTKYLQYYWSVYDQIQNVVFFPVNIKSRLDLVHICFEIREIIS